MARAQNRRQKNIIERFADNFLPPILRRNAVGDNLKGIPLFNRGSGIRQSEFGQVVMTEQDNYVGYLYSAIRKRAKRTAALGATSIKTRDRVTEEEVEEPHPYISVIDSSPSFSNNYLYKALSTFIDLKGAAYLMAVRNFTRSTNPIYGQVKEFKIINPFKLQRVVNKAGESAGYIEWRGSAWRTIPEEMMIPILDLNPFNMADGYAMVDAAKEDQYLNRSSSAYTRNAIKNNVGQRGLITTDVILEDEDFANFKGAVEENAGVQTAGKFIYGNGPGSIKYTDMQIDLEKLALEKINEISREGLFAAAGVSKTILGIEMSGVTRESGRVQNDLFTNDEIIPQLQTIIDALNQDYRNKYKNRPTDFKDIELFIDSPLKTDREAEKTDAETLKLKAEAAKTLVDAGFEPSAVLEEVGIEDIAFVGTPLRIPAGFGGSDENKLRKSKIKPKHTHEIDHEILNVEGFDETLKPLVAAKQSSLENSIVNIEREIFQASFKKLDKNQLTPAQQDDTITKTDKNRIEKELAIILAAFLSSMVALFGTQTMKQRFREFGLLATFKVTGDMEKAIKAYSKKAAGSHVDTVLEEIYKTARSLAEKGAGREEIMSGLRKRFDENVSKERAKRIARTEANYSIGTAQYEADRQFLKQNDLGARAYKRWITRSSNPCPFCTQMQDQTAANPIPFDDPFAGLGTVLEAVFEGEKSTTTRSMSIGYVPIEHSTMHPNCSCIYELIIK